MVDRHKRDRADRSKIFVEQFLDNACRVKDTEVLLIEFIDRLHNMQTVSSMNKEKEEKQLREKLEYFLLLNASIKCDF